MLLSYTETILSNLSILHSSLQACPSFLSYLATFPGVPFPLLTDPKFNQIFLSKFISSGQKKIHEERMIENTFRGNSPYGNYKLAINYVNPIL